jgi:ubiquitin-protein ligase
MSSKVIDLCEMVSDEELEVLDLTNEQAAGTRGRKRTRRERENENDDDDDDDDDVFLMGETSRPMRNDEAGPSNRSNNMAPPSSLHRPPLAVAVTNDQAYSLDCGCSFASSKALQSQLLDMMTTCKAQEAKGKKKAPSTPHIRLDLCACSKCSAPLSHRDIRALLPTMDEIYQEAAAAPTSSSGTSSSSSPSIRDLLNKLREEILKADSGSTGRSKKTASKQNKSKPSSTGVGYGGGINESGTQKVAKGLEAAAKKQDAHDKKTLETLSSMAKAVRSSMKAGNSSQPPPASIVAAVFSSLPFLLRLLLSNDSMTDIAQRQDLYRGLIDLLRALSSSTDLVEVFLLSTTDPQEDSQEPSTSNVNPEPPTVFHILQNVNKQCMIYQRSAESLGDGDDETISALSLALELSSLFDDVLSSVSIFCLSMGQSSDPMEERDRPNRKTKRKVPDNVRDQRYITALRQVQFSECNELQEQHYFRDQADKSRGGGGEVMRKRLRRITEEVSTLSTSLPAAFDSSICLAVDTGRMDLLRAVIFPASDTPYSSGAFLFDIFLPAEYPNVPPQFKFLTTGGGIVRFNPNLYADGKVCLSLLGTWSGPSWDPATSTLLQVLVSIQAMILGTHDPWYNEPGYETRAATPQGKEESRAYNESLRVETVRLALLPMVELACSPGSSGGASSSVPTPLDTFIDPVKIHVEAKKGEIIRQCQVWLKECTSSGNKQKMKTSVDRILKLLK